jgi:hypothetical protein
MVIYDFPALALLIFLISRPEKTYSLPSTKCPKIHRFNIGQSRYRFLFDASKYRHGFLLFQLLLAAIYSSRLSPTGRNVDAGMREEAVCLHIGLEDQRSFLIFKDTIFWPRHLLLSYAIYAHMLWSFWEDIGMYTHAEDMAASTK